MLKKKTTAPPTIADRLGTAAALHGAATSVFTSIVEDFEEAAAIADDAAATAAAEIDRLIAERDAALEQFRVSTEAASRVKTTFGV